MLGVSLSAVTGELIAQILTGSPTSLDVAPFSPSRFG
jgi:D-amino-acid dehydrogenase